MSWDDTGYAYPMFAHMLALRHHCEIVRMVVQLVAVDMMNDLSRQQRATNFLFSHNSVLVPT